MPGSWEIKEQNKVLVGILHTDIVPMAWALGLRNLIVPGVICPVSGMPFDMARNTLVEHTLQGGFEYCFMLDSDVVPPRDAILRLIAHNLPIVSGMYCRRSPPHSVPVAIKNGTWLVNFPLGSMQEVDLVGSGCLLVHRSVFEQVPHQRREKKWFDWRVDTQHIWTQEELAKQPPLSEDFTWCHHVRSYGYKIWLDSSIQCRHVGLAQATYGNLQPCEATPVT